jgi:hypothetical protein
MLEIPVADSPAESDGTCLWSNEIREKEYVREDEIGELVTLLARPWFTRTWVVQEVVLARKVVVEYGNNSIDWDDIVYACRATRVGGPVFEPTASQLRMFSDIELFRRAYRVILYMLNTGDNRTDMTINYSRRQDQYAFSLLYL